MRKNLPLWSALALGFTAMLGLNSCDPYYYSGSYSAGYSSVPAGYDSGYGSGWGYGNPSFSTSFFVSTGSPMWGYDPYCRSYYNYHRRCYYDPYLYGYYPVGYRPPIIVGVPHPHGYRSNYCPPPVRVTNVTLHNYERRAERYGSLNQPWSRQVRMHDYQRSQPAGRGGYERGVENRRGYGSTAGGYGADPRVSRQGAPPERSSWFGGLNRRPNTAQSVPQPGYQPEDPRLRRDSRGSGLPTQYNRPVTSDPMPARSQDMRMRRGTFTPPAPSPQPSRPFQPQLPQQVQPQAPAPQPAAPQPPPQIERRMPDRSEREAPRQVERPMPERIERPAPVAPPSPQPAPGATTDRGHGARMRGIARK